VRVKVLEPDELIKPDMNATVAFFAPKKSAATQPVAASESIRVPADAIRDKAVFIVEDGKAIRKPVTTGLGSAGGEVEIRKGLIGGEDLILNPPEQLKDGDRVSVEGNSN